MKVALNIFLICLACCSCNKSGKTVDEKIPKTFFLKSSERLSVKNDVVFLNKTPYTGYLYELSPGKDTLLSEGYFNGKMSGVCKKWYASNRLREERNYLSGQKHGKQVTYWENGNKRFEFIAKNDVYEGELKEWSINGHLFHLGTYVNGQEEGPQKMWYDNGKIRANYVIIKGKRYGLLGTKNCKNVSDSIFIVK